MTEAEKWKLRNLIEAGRSEVLKQAAQGDTLESILNTLCRNSEIYNKDMRTSVLKLNLQKGTLHPCASVSLPQEYCDALDGVKVGLGVGSCGTAAFIKERTIVDDINTHPYWAQYKELALAYNLQSCWSEPVMGKNGRCFGTFAIYYEYPNSPSEEDLTYIQTCANLAAVVFETIESKDKLITANEKLSKTIDERNIQLQQANQELLELLEESKQQTISHLNQEKAYTTQLFSSGIAHEINTPMGISLTSNSQAQEIVANLLAKINTGSLTKRFFNEQLTLVNNCLELQHNGLTKSIEIIDKLKQINSHHNNQNETVLFDLKSFFDDLIDIYHSKYKELTIRYSSEQDLTLYKRVELIQIFNHLIENSITHGFEDIKHGTIDIYAIEKTGGIEFNYQDNGKGIDAKCAKNIFEPFYTSKRGSGNFGLGLSAVQSSVVNVFNGKIDFIPSPLGVRFSIFIPFTSVLPNS